MYLHRIPFCKQRNLQGTEDTDGKLLASTRAQGWELLLLAVVPLSIKYGCPASGCHCSWCKSAVLGPGALLIHGQEPGWITYLIWPDPEPPLARLPPGTSWLCSWTGG